jgi:hypothetical protein
VAWIIDREAERSERNKPKLFVMSAVMDKNIVGLTRDKRKDSVIFVDHPDEGYDLSFHREGVGLKTRYASFLFDRDPSPINNDAEAQNEIMEFIIANPVPETLQSFDAEYLSNILFGTAEEADEDLDEESDDPRDRPRGRHEDEPEDEETDDQQDTGEDEEAEQEDQQEEADSESEDQEQDDQDAGEDEEEPDTTPRRRSIREPEERERPRAASSNGRQRERERQPERTSGSGNRPRGTVVQRRPKERSERNYRR